MRRYFALAFIFLVSVTFSQTPVTATWTRSAVEAMPSVVDTLGTRRAVVNGALVTITDRTTNRNITAFTVLHTVRDLQFAPDGASLAISDSNGQVNFFSPTTGANLASVSMGAEGQAYQLILFRRGSTNHMLTIHASVAKLWTRTGTNTWTSGFSYTNVGGWNHAAVKPNGLEFAIGVGAQIRIYSIATPNNNASPVITTTFTTNHLAFNPDGTRLAAEADGSGIQLYDTNGYLALPGTIVTGDGNYKLEFAPDGLSIWAVVYQLGRRVARYSLNGDRLFMSATFFSNPNDIDVAMNDGQFTMVNGDFEEGVHISMSGQTTFGPLIPGRGIWFSPMDATRSLIGTSSGFIGVIDNLTGDTQRVFDADVNGPIYQVIANAQSKRIAAVVSNANGNSALRLYDYNFSPIAMFPAFEIDGTLEIAFNPQLINGKRQIAFCDGRIVQIFDSANGSAVAAFFQPARVYCVAYSKDGSRMATGGQDGIVRFYRTDTYQEVAAVDLDYAVQNVHFGDITNRLVAFRDHSATAVVLTRTAVGDTWTKGLYTDLPNVGVGYKTAVSPDGNTVLVSDDSSTRVLQLDTASLAILRDFGGGAYKNTLWDDTQVGFTADGLQIIQGLEGNYVFGSHLNQVPVFLSTVDFSVNPVNRGSSTQLTVRLSRPAVAGTQITISYPSNKITGPTVLTPAVGLKIATATINVAASAAVGQYPITITLGRQVKPKLTVQ